MKRKIDIDLLLKKINGVYPSELANIFDVSAPLISYHLRKLKNAGKIYKDDITGKYYLCENKKEEKKINIIKNKEDDKKIDKIKLSSLSEDI